MQEYASKVIAMRKAEPRNDLISNFALAEIDGDRLDDREVLLTTTTLIMAGVESLGGFMMMFAYNLATFDEARRAVVANPDLLPDAIEESLRFNTSAQRFRRRLMKDVTMHGQTMKRAILCAWPTARATAMNVNTPTLMCTISVANRVVIWVLVAESMLAWELPLRAWLSKSLLTSFIKLCQTTGVLRISCLGCLRPLSAAHWC